MRVAQARRLPLLGAMARDLDQHGALRPTTASAMWAACLAHSVLTTRALRRPAIWLPLPARSAKLAGAALAT